MSSIAFAVVYETKLQTVSQTIKQKWLTGWANRTRIVINHNEVTNDLSNFPVLLHVSSSSGINAQNVTYIFDKVGSNSQKIAVTTLDNTSWQSFPQA
jgi:hypothetical protein